MDGIGMDRTGWGWDGTCPDGSGQVGTGQEGMGPHPTPSGAIYQLEHPGAAAAGGEAAKGAQKDNDGASAHQDEGDIGGLLVQQGEVDGQADPAPDAHGQQHDTRHLGERKAAVVRDCRDRAARPRHVVGPGQGGAVAAQRSPRRRRCR